MTINTKNLRNLYTSVKECDGCSKNPKTQPDWIKSCLDLKSLLIKHNKECICSNCIIKIICQEDCENFKALFRERYDEYFSKEYNGKV